MECSRVPHGDHTAWRIVRAAALALESYMMLGIVRYHTVTHNASRYLQLLEILGCIAYLMFEMTVGDMASLCCYR